MNKNTNLQNMDDFAIEIERTERFKEIAQKLSDFIKDLPLSHEDNESLIELMIQQVQEAEKGAFSQGFAMGYKFGQDTAK